MKNSNKKQNYKSRKPASKERVTKKEEFRSPCFLKEVEKGNDFGWYNKNGNLTNVASSYYLSNPAGKPVGNLNVDYANNQKTAIPGILTIEMLPAFAPTSLNANTSSVSGLNLASKQLYAKMRKANAGARSQYEAPDLLLYVLSIESIYAFVASLVRCYGFLSQYPTNNRYYSKKVVEAMGFDYDDLIKNRLQFYNFINTCMYRLKRFVVPAGFSSVNRSVWVNSNVFVDGTGTVKSQIYIPKYIGYWKFNSKTMASGGCLEIALIGTTPRTLASLEAYFSDLIAPIAQDDDFLTISGDIMKFTENYFTMQEIALDFVLNPIYEEDVMLQLHNLNYISLGNASSTVAWEADDDYDFPSDLPGNSTYTIFQKDGLLYFQPVLNLEKDTTLASQITTYKSIHQDDASQLYIDTPEDDPSVIRVTEATRLITVYDTESAVNETTLPIKTCGHEIITNIRIYNDVSPVFIDQYHYITDVETTAAYAAQITLMSPFMWDVRISGLADIEGYSSICRTHWNTRSVGIFDAESFTRLNDIITMSLLTLE